MIKNFMTRHCGVRVTKMDIINKGINDGIRQLISTLQDITFSRENTLLKLQDKYALSPEEAEKYMAEYWKD